MKLSGWGRYPVLDAQLHVPRDFEALRTLVRAQATVIARGNGRAYGDSAVNRTATLDMRHFNRMLAFDPDQGQLVAEAGLRLEDILETFLPQGWFPAVTPGTKHVTLGGMIAADVHGKNHHKDGSFGRFVDWIDVMGPGGEIRRCARDDARDLFDWTIGGMGLTGIILRAAIRLRPVESGWIRQTTVPAATLEETMAAFEAAQGASYSAAWIDCLARGRSLGRSLLLLGEHARRADLGTEQAAQPYHVPSRRRLRVPFDLPAGTLNRTSMRAFNAAYHLAGRRHRGERLVGWDSYFYPLDAILDWNRIYGRRGFVQFQCVLPLRTSRAGLTALLETTSAAGAGAFLAVLKKLGAQESRISFPMEGYTLALDFPVSRATNALLARLDAITLAHEGRFYLAKDAHLDAGTFHSADPRGAAMRAVRTEQGWADRFGSAQSERLSL